MRRPGPGDGHVALHGNGGHGEDRRHDGHVGHEVRHLAEDQSEYPISVDRDMIIKILSAIDYGLLLLILHEYKVKCTVEYCVD